jgi:hypothetical protein
MRYWIIIALVRPVALLFHESTSIAEVESILVILLILWLSYRTGQKGQNVTAEAQKVERPEE